jgi:hypothetical protein
VIDDLDGCVFDLNLVTSADVRESEDDQTKADSPILRCAF